MIIICVTCFHLVRVHLFLYLVLSVGLVRVSQCLILRGCVSSVSVHVYICTCFELILSKVFALEHLHRLPSSPSITPGT